MLVMCNYTDDEPWEFTSTTETVLIKLYGRYFCISDVIEFMPIPISNDHFTSIKIGDTHIHFTETRTIITQPSGYSVDIFRGSSIMPNTLYVPPEDEGARE